MFRLKEIYKMYFFMYLSFSNNNVHMPIERKGILDFYFHDIDSSGDEFLGPTSDSQSKIDFAMQKIEIEDPASFAGNNNKETFKVSGDEKPKLILNDDIVWDLKNTNLLVAPPEDIKKLTSKDKAEDDFMSATDLPRLIIAAIHTGLGIISNIVRVPDVFLNSIIAFGDFDDNYINAAQNDDFDHQDPSLAKVTIFDITNEDQWIDMDFAAEQRTQWRHFRRNSA